MKNPFGITFRPCTRHDFDFVFNLIRKTLHEPYVSTWFPLDKKHFKEEFDRNFSSNQIMVKGKRRSGIFQITKVSKDELHIDRMYLSPAYQGKGIGSFLLKHCETLGYKKISLEVWENNPAKYLYKKHGYKQVSKKNHKIRMEKLLSS